jgi:antitoxin CptB
MDKARLRWGCRRGMLELDLILLPFFENQWGQLSKPDQLAFEQLLSEADQDIYAWILNFQTCLNPRFADILVKIRHHHDINFA